MVNTRFISVRATATEKRMPLQGDTLIPGGGKGHTHAITINAGPEDIWPWLVQMGSDKAGWYSYDFIDNPGRQSSWELMPGCMELTPGDIIVTRPGTDEGFIVKSIDPPTSLILVIPDSSGGYSVTWEFSLRKIDDKSTRVIVRARMGKNQSLGRDDGSPFERGLEISTRVERLLGKLPSWISVPVLVLGHHIMQTGQLRAIKARVERYHR